MIQVGLLGTLLLLLDECFSPSPLVHIFLYADFSFGIDVLASSIVRYTWIPNGRLQEDRQTKTKVSVR